MFVVSSCLVCYWFLYAGIMTDELRNFLELNLPKVKEGKKAKFSLGVAEPKIGSHIFEVTKIPCQSNEFVHELLRGVRLHFERFIKDLKVCIFSDACFSFLLFKFSCYLFPRGMFLTNYSLHLQSLSTAWWLGESPTWSGTQLQQSKSEVQCQPSWQYGYSSNLPSWYSW